MLKQDEKRKKEEKVATITRRVLRKFERSESISCLLRIPKIIHSLSHGEERKLPRSSPQRSIPPVIRETNPPPNRVAIKAAEGGEGRFQKISSTEE